MNTTTEEKEYQFYFENGACNGFGPDMRSALIQCLLFWKDDYSSQDPPRLLSSLGELEKVVALEHGSPSRVSPVTPKVDYAAFDFGL